MFARNQQGSVLVVVMVAMAALLILGGTLSTAALSDQRQAIRQQKNNEAYYIARSGAEAVEAVLIKNFSGIHNYIGLSTEGELGSGRFETKVIEGDDGAVVIESTGYAGNQSEKLTLTLTFPGDGDSGDPAGPGFLPIFDMAVFSHGNIKLEGSSKIVGNAATGSIERGAVDFANDQTSVENLYIGPGGDPAIVVNAPKPSRNYQSVGNLEKERLYPEPVFPDFPTGLPRRSDIIATGNIRNLLINQPGQYNEIKIDGSCKLTIDVGNSDLVIRAKKFIVDGNADVEINRTGDGKLLLYVEDIFTSTAHFNENGPPGALIIYYQGTSENLKFSDWQKLPAHFFAKQATLEIGGSGGLIGNMITLGDSVIIKGGSHSVVRVVYAPNAHVKVLGSGGLRGAIVSSSCSLSGDARVIYDSEAIEMWGEVPDFEFYVGADPGEPGSDPGCGVGDYTRVWSE